MSFGEHIKSTRVTGKKHNPDNKSIKIIPSSTDVRVRSEYVSSIAKENTAITAQDSLECEQWMHLKLIIH